MKKPGQIQFMNERSAGSTVSLHQAMLMGKETNLWFSAGNLPYLAIWFELWKIKSHVQAEGTHSSQAVIPSGR